MLIPLYTFNQDTFFYRKMTSLVGVVVGEFSWGESLGEFLGEGVVLGETWGDIKGESSLGDGVGEGDGVKECIRIGDWGGDGVTEGLGLDAGDGWRVEVG